MWRFYIYVTVIIVVLTAASYLLSGNFQLTKMVFFSTTLASGFASVLLKKALKTTKGMEDY
jgi:hypothetical protein